MELIIGAFAYIAIGMIIATGTCYLFKQGMETYKKEFDRLMSKKEQAVDFIEMARYRDQLLSLEKRYQTEAEMQNTVLKMLNEKAFYRITWTVIVFGWTWILIKISIQKWKKEY